MASSFVFMFMVVCMIPAVSCLQAVVQPQGSMSLTRLLPLAMRAQEDGDVKKGEFIPTLSGSVDEETVETANLGAKEEAKSDDMAMKKTKMKEAGRPAAPPPFSRIEFGGTRHGATNKMNPDDKMNPDEYSEYLERPEAVKSQACINKECQDCTEPQACWHGTDDKDARGTSWGRMSLSVPAGGSFTHYTAEVWARCKASIGTWYFRSWTMVNGEVVVTRNGVELHRTSVPDKGYKNIGLPEGDSRMRVSFSLTDRNKAASSKFGLTAWKVDASVDGCMTVKECMDKLGDGSIAAFELRNGNSKQLKCLKGDMSTMSTALQQKCTAWEKCVVGTGKKDSLLALLKAASAPKPGSLITAVVKENRTRDSDFCVHPAVDDPESWECECAKDMVAKCGHSESCLQNLMCENPGICESWKQNHCSTFSSLMVQRSAKGAVINGIDNNLDGAIQGKCSQ